MKISQNAELLSVKTAKWLHFRMKVLTSVNLSHHKFLTDLLFFTICMQPKNLDLNSRNLGSCAGTTSS